LDVTLNNATNPSDWKKALVFPVYKWGDRLLVSNYRLVSLTSMVYKKMEHVISSYLRKFLDKLIGYSIVNMDLGWDIHVKVM
jgi:hypothetical protein